MLECVTHLATCLVTIDAGVCDTLDSSTYLVSVGAEACGTLADLPGYS